MEKAAKPRRNWLFSGLVISGMLLTLLLGCSAASRPEPVVEQVFVEKMVEAEEVAPRAPAGSEYFEEPALDQAQATDRLIIRTGRISVVVEDTRAARATIEAMVAGMADQGAFVVSGDESGGTGGAQPYITMSIRVPATAFGRTMDRLAEMAVEVTNRNESAQDVTEEYVDLEARLESLEAARLRLLGIIEEARTTKDLLEAEQQLTQREAEIESIKGRMKYLSQSADLSSIWVELQPSILSQPVDDKWRPAETVRRALEALLAGLRGLGDFAIFFTIAVLPWLLLVGLVVLAVVWFVRRRARASRRKQEAEG
jgi:hypothetical protein